MQHCQCNYMRVYYKTKEADYIETGYMRASELPLGPLLETRTFKKRKGEAVCKNK